jgi:hypothetical protein
MSTHQTSAPKPDVYRKVTDSIINAYKGRSNNRPRNAA